MREIKFRAWNGKRMLLMGPEGFCDFEIHGGAVFECDDIGYQINEKQYPLMQYTGLKDRNGVEIYEGDLLEVKGVRICEVIFHKLAGCWDLKLVNCHSSESIGAVSPASYQYNTLVIGNIHESPELLEG